MKISINTIRELLSSIPLKFRKYNDSQLISETEWIIELEKLFRKMKRIYPRYPIKVFLKEYIFKITSCIQNDSAKKLELKNNWLHFFDSSDDNIKMFMIPMFVMTDLFDEVTCKRIMIFAKETKNVKNRYWITINISRIAFRCQSGFYDSFYYDRQILLKKIAEESNIIVPHKSKLNSNRLCIITYLLSPDIHNSMQRVAMMYANNLNSYFDETMVMSIETCFSSKSDYKDGYVSIYRIDSSLKKIKRIKSMFNDGVAVKILKKKRYEERMQESLDEIYAFNPSVIIDISDEYSPMSYYYSKDFFTAYFPIRGASSSQFYSRIIGDIDSIRTANSKFPNCVDINSVIMWNFPEYVPKDQGCISREVIGIKKDSFCIISIGNHASYNQEFIDMICALLFENESFVWLLVGSNVPSYIKNEYNSLLEQRKIIDWGFEDNLAGICKSCDILLRYNTTGGSGGTAIAAMQGLPIAMTRFLCDASRWLGMDYSNCNNYSDLSNEIMRLYSDKSYYHHRKLQTIELVKRAVDSKEKWSKLNSLLHDERMKWEEEKDAK